MRRLRSAVAFVWVLALLGLGCGAGEAPAPAAPSATGPRLVLLYLPCTVSKRFLSPYAPDVPFTPHLADFAAEGLVFERHQTEAGITGVSMASILTGSQALHHGVYGHPEPLDDDTILLAEVFADAGYETFFYDRHLMASARLHYGQGVPPLNVYTLAELEQGDRYLKKILKRLQEDPEYRAFVMVLFATAHWPYSEEALGPFCEAYPDLCSAPPGEEDDFERWQALYRDDDNFLRLAYDRANRVKELGLTPADMARYDRAVERLYRASIYELDTRFGGTLQDIRQAGLLDESLIVFTADHGEVADRDNAVFQWTHGHALAPEVLGVPLLIRAPQLGVPTGRYEPVTRSIDLLRTIAGLAGVEVPEAAGSGGVDLSPAIRGEEPPPHLEAFSHTAVLPPKWVEGARAFPFFHHLYPRTDPELMWVSIRDGDEVFKYRNLGDEVFGFEAFDLASDPDERRNRFDANDPRDREMQERLLAYKSALVRDWKARAGTGAPEVPEAEQIELLRSIGYIQ